MPLGTDAPTAAIGAHRFCRPLDLAHSRLQTLCSTSRPAPHATKRRRTTNATLIHPCPAPSPPGPPPLTRRGFAGLVGAGAATALAGCASQDTSKDLDTLQVWGGVPPENGPQAVVDHFMETHPDLKVTYTRFVNDDRGNLKVNTALQGGVDIDVFFTYDPSNLAMRSLSGMAADSRRSGALHP